MVIWVEKGEEIYPVQEKNNIPIVMSSSEEFLPYTCVTIYSIMQNATHDFHFDFVLLNSGYSSEALKQLNSLFNRWEHCSLRLIDARSYLQLSKLNIQTIKHVSKETYYRLLIPLIMKNYHKTIYLDSDLIVLKDISSLWLEIDSQNPALLYGVPDIDVIGQYNQGYAMKFYLRHILHLSQPNRYLQTGVLAFNIDLINRMNMCETWISVAYKSKLKYVDQDVLNFFCNDRVMLLDWRWNVVTDCGYYRINQVISQAPYLLQEAYLKSRKEPWIIHYSGFEKPWNNSGSDMADIYLNYIQGLDIPLSCLKTNNGLVVKPCQVLKQKLKKIILFFFPKQTKRNDLLSLLLNIITYSLHGEKKGNRDNG